MRDANVCTTFFAFLFRRFFFLKKKKSIAHIVVVRLDSQLPTSNAHDTFDARWGWETWAEKEN